MNKLCSTCGKQIMVTRSCACGDTCEPAMPSKGLLADKSVIAIFRLPMSVTRLLKLYEGIGNAIAQQEGKWFVLREVNERHPSAAAAPLDWPD